MADQDAPYDRYRRTRYFGSLDGLRFLCIFMVLWHHSPVHALMEEPARLWTRGFTGVNFFFVLSGFLITTLLLREEEATGRISLAQFYRRRILRIVPVYFFVVTAVAAYYVLWKGRDDLLPLVPFYYLFLSNFLLEDIPLLTITWSLAAEEQYYLIWPLILILVPALMKVRTGILVGLIGLCVASTTGSLQWLGLRPVQTEYAIWQLPGTSYSAILVGSLLGVLLHWRRGFEAGLAFLGSRWSPAVAFAALILVLSMLPIDLNGLPFLLVHLTMAICIAALVIREDHVLRPVLAWKPVARIGEISYGIYLYHLIGLHLATVLMDRLPIETAPVAWAVTLTYPIISILIAEISYRTLERYFLSLKKRKSTGLLRRLRTRTGAQ